MRWAELALLLLIGGAFVGVSRASRVVLAAEAYVFEGKDGSSEPASFGVGFGSEAFTVEGARAKARHTSKSAGLVRSDGLENGLLAES